MLPTLSKKSVKISCTIAGILLLIIGLFHASGINYVNGMVQESDVSQLVKNVFPVLFISPSIQLIGIGVVGFFAIKKDTHYDILFTLSILVLVDAIFAFLLNAIIPGIILLIPAIVYLVAAWSSWKNK